MGIKLLPKSEIDKLKAAEQRIAVQEGLKLARRVDNLREAAADTEAALKKFRNTTLTNIHEEITQKTKEKASLLHEVEILKEERAALQKPLDSAWAAVHTASRELDERAERTDATEHLLADRAREIAIQEKKVAALLTRAESREDIATRSLAEAADAEKVAKLALSTAERLKREAIVLRNKTNQELMHRDLLASGRERSVTMRETDLAAREQALADGWKLLNDRQAMFERNLTRN